MSKRSGKKSHKSSPVVVEPKEKVDVKVDLRTAPPVRRMRLVLAQQFEAVELHLAKLTYWSDTNSAAAKAHAILLHIVEMAEAFDAEMTTFEATGWSPPRKSYTAKTEEGDSVAILEDMKDSYTELMDAKLMGDLKVVKKHPGNRGGGLIVEAKDGSRMKVSISHVVKMASAA
jgi:hypothetical protein